MKQRIIYLLSAVCLISVSLLSITGCKEDTLIDASVIPAGDTANTFIIPDTVTILTKTVFADSLATSIYVAGIPVIQGLGTVDNQIPGDPYFGKTNASIYFQVVPPTLGFTFPATPDSAFLILPYAGFMWGDSTATNVPQTFNVYQLADSITKDSTYYSYTTKAVDRSNLLGSVTVSYNPTTMHPSLADSLYIDGRNVQPHLRVKLSQDFINKIKNEAANGTSFSGYASFLSFLKGLVVEPDTTAGFGNTLYYFQLDGTNDYNRANILFYYPGKNSSNVDTELTTSLYFDPTYDSHFNKVKRNLTGTPTGNLVASTNSSDSLIVIENEPGAALDIQIPNVKYLPQHPILKAELIITQITNDFTALPFLDQYEKFVPPARIYPVGIKADGTTYTIQDRYPTSSVEPLIFIDGLRKDAVVNGKTVSRYVVNIPREIQKAIIEKRDTLHLRINGAVTYPGAYRLIGGGRNLSNPDLRIKLNIVYSKI